MVRELLFYMFSYTIFRCHRAEKVGENAVIVSRPIKCLRSSTRRDANRLGRRRTSSQSTSASGGSGRLASPDSPLDRKAVVYFISSVAIVEPTFIMNKKI